jgi:hypothetical protein
MLKNEKGTILVEFIGSFLLFFLLIISILSLVNIVTAQARVHYALTETANTLSMYGYVISAADNAPQKIKKTVGEIHDVLDILNKFGSGFSSWKGSAPSIAMNAVIGVFSGDMQVADIKKDIRQLILNNLSAGNQSGEDYLRSVRIRNIEVTDFAPLYAKASGKESALCDYRGNIKLTVEYEIDYTFMGLPLPFEPKLKIAQSVMTKIWFQRLGYNG